MNRADDDLKRSILQQQKVGLTATELYCRFPVEHVLSWFERLPSLLLYVFEEGHGQSWHACRFASAYPITDETAYRPFAEALGMNIPWDRIRVLDTDGQCTYNASRTSFFDPVPNLRPPVIPLRIRDHLHAAFEQELLDVEWLGQIFELVAAFDNAARAKGYTPVIPPFDDNRTVTAARLDTDLHPDRREQI